MPTASESEARAWLIAQVSPRAVDEILARSLTNSCGVTARVAMDSRFPENGPSYQVAAGCALQLADGPSYQVAAGCALQLADGADLDLAAARLEAAMAPPSEEQAAAWLVMVEAGCVRRPGSEATSAAVLSLYSGALRQYPADVAKAACFDWVRRSKWFPALSELLELAERFVGPRRAMLAAVRSPSLNAPETPTPEERQAVGRQMQALRDGMPREPARPAYRFTQAQTDEDGLTAQMRAHLARHSA